MGLHNLRMSKEAQNRRAKVQNDVMRRRQKMYKETCRERRQAEIRIKEERKSVQDEARYQTKLRKQMREDAAAAQVRQKELDLQSDLSREREKMMEEQAKIDVIALQMAKLQKRELKLMERVAKLHIAEREAMIDLEAVLAAVQHPLLC